MNLEYKMIVTIVYYDANNQGKEYHETLDIDENMRCCDLLELYFAMVSLPPSATSVQTSNENESSALIQRAVVLHNGQ